MSIVSTVTTSTTILVPADTKKSKKIPESVAKQLQFLSEFLFGKGGQSLRNYDVYQLHAADDLAFSVVKAKKQEIALKEIYAAVEKTFYADPENIQAVLLRDFAQVKAARKELYLDDSCMLISYWHLVQQNPALHEEQEKEFTYLREEMVIQWRKWIQWKEALEEIPIEEDEPEIMKLVLPITMDEFIKGSIENLKNLFALQSVDEFKALFPYGPLYRLKYLIQLKVFKRIALRWLNRVSHDACGKEKVFLFQYMKLRWKITAKAWFCKALQEHLKEDGLETQYQHLVFNSVKSIAAEGMSPNEISLLLKKKIEEETRSYASLIQPKSTTLHIEVVDDEKSPAY